MATDKTIITRVAPLEASLSGNPTNDLSSGASRARILQALTFLEALVFSALVGMFIWRWQAADRYSWAIFPVWLVGSFLLHQDTPKTLGWRGDNLWIATRQGLL